MSVIVDTPIWSFAYRRAKRSRREQQAVDALGELVRRDHAWLIGPVRQEVLSGFSHPAQFDDIRATLRAFDDVELTTMDFERAAEFHNVCRRKGVQGSPTDFLICAVSVRCAAQVFTTARDFHRYAKLTGVSLYKAPRR